jgi:hypothetical protein
LVLKERWRSIPLPRRIAAVVAIALLSAVGFVPLFGGPGYEMCVASGIVLPATAAVAVALELSAASDRAPLASVMQGLGTGALLAGLAYATALLHGLRVGMCDFWGGTVLFALTAGFGAVLGGLWGVAVAELCRGRRRRRVGCVLLALAGPLGGIVISLVRFYTSPMVFAYDPFFGYFSGTLYDTIVDVRTELWTYRAGSVATIGAAILLASVLVRTPQGVLALGPVRARADALARLGLGVATAVVSLAMCAEGPALGHWQTAGSIADALAGRASGPRCDVVYPDTLVGSQVTLLVRDCEQDLVADEERLGTHLEGRLTAFFFRDAEQKRLLMGAADTQIAKPWRREVYVQVAGFPHPVLGHEIAHVVAGSFGRGPLRIAGAIGGLLPNPGLIEGTAVAASPDDDELTDAQWARAMLDLGILPPIRDLFSLGFLGENASKSYTVAGAFVSWIADRWGAAALRAWYGGGSIEALTGKSWASLEAEFHEALRGLAMPPEASAYAKAKFARPSVWSRRCPHAVDALVHRADRCRDEHQFARAASLYAEALGRDPLAWHATYERARIDLKYGDEARGRSELDLMAGDERSPRTWRDRAAEALADDDFVRGRDERALDVYRALAGRTLDEDAARTLEVKAFAASHTAARRPVLDLLVGEPGRPLDSWLAALSLGVWTEQGSDPLAAYLAGKNLVLHEQYARAKSWLDRAPLTELTPRVAREALRQRAVCACALGDVPALEQVEKAALEPGSPFEGTSGGRREWVLRLVARCKRGS